MRVIKSDSGFLLYEKIFKQLMNNQWELLLWQVSPSSGERLLTPSKLNSFHMESGKLFFEIKSKQHIHENWPIYCYVQDGPLIFKADIQDLYETNVSVTLPTEIKVLEDPEVITLQETLNVDLYEPWRVKRLNLKLEGTGLEILRIKSMAQRSSRDRDLLNNEFNLSLDEEDRLFADKRESPRARPKVDKWVKIAKILGDGPQMYRLFDLSRGGLGFVVKNDAEFPKGTEVHIVGFHDFDLDDPLVGTIVSGRPVDDTESEFKIGIKFTDGQN